MIVKRSVGVRNEHQNNVCKLFRKLTGRFNLWKLWGDFVTLSAIEISNCVDLGNKGARNEEYKRVAKQYTPEDMEVFAQILAEIVNGMEEDPDQDFLGELFMALDLGNDAGGQFFTPYNVCRMMARINDIDRVKDAIDKYGFASVNDCACGAGATLIAFANECRRQGINYQESVLFVAQDIDYITGLMCYIQLSLLGCPGYVYIGDTLTDPCLSIDKRGLIPEKPEKVWLTPMYVSHTWSMRKLWHVMGWKEPKKMQPEELVKVKNIDDTVKCQGPATAKEVTEADEYVKTKNKPKKHKTTEVADVQLSLL